MLPLTVALALAGASSAQSQTLRPPNDDFRPHTAETCVDAAGRPAQCWLDSGAGGLVVHYQQECRASDSVHRCPSDPLCHGPSGRAVTCTKPVYVALFRCKDGWLTPFHEERCEDHGGVGQRLSPKAFVP